MGNKSTQKIHLIEMQVQLNLYLLINNAFYVSYYTV